MIKKSILSLLPLGSLLGTLLIFGGAPPLYAETFLERQSDTQFDKTVTFTHKGETYSLDATGASLRRKWFVKGYAVAHYMQSPTKGDQEAVLKEVFSSDKAKEINMIWLHKLPLALIKEGFQESLQKNLKEAEYTALKPEIEKFLAFFKADAQVGDVTIFRWLPGGYLELTNNDEKLGSMVNLELARALWSIWLGPESVVNRKQMISLVETN
ncbi:MAG: chalcone isomerase family protein [Chlamydiales bacterium]|nr:chalcone isomerase family protein [Chlamydiales bacterium]